MTETKIEYYIETQVRDGEWLLSDYTLNSLRNDDIEVAKQLIKQARDTHQATILNYHTVTPRKYRLLKQTHCITTEVVDENE